MYKIPNSPPIPVIILIASSACSEPMTPGTKNEKKDLSSSLSSLSVHNDAHNGMHIVCLVQLVGLFSSNFMKNTDS